MNTDKRYRILTAPKGSDRWSADPIGDENEFEFVSEARDAIRQLIALGDDWHNAAYGIGYADSPVPFEQYPDAVFPTYAPLSGEDGNVFAVLGRAMWALRRDGKWRDADECRARVTRSASYAEALAVICEYVLDGEPPTAEEDF